MKLSSTHLVGDMDPMRIILVNRYFHPDESATSRIVSSLAFGLAARGIQVDVLAGRYRHDDANSALPSRETVQGVVVHRLVATHFGRAHLAGRAADYASFHARAALWCLAHVRPGNIVVACTDPPLLSVSLAAAIAPRGGHLLNWLHDVFPEVAIELGVIERARLSARWTLAVRDWSLRRAVRNVVPTVSMAHGLASRGIRGGIFNILPYWSEEDEIIPVKPGDNALRKAWGLEAAFVVGYSGNFGRAHEFDTLLDAAETLRDDPGIRFLLIGNGFGRPHVEAEIRRRGLDATIVLRPLQPRTHLSESLGVADIHLISLLPALEPYVIPSKLYGIMAAGRPAFFIGSADGEVANTLRRHDCGDAVPIGEGRALATRILALQQNPVRREAMGANARAGFEQDHSKARAMTAWAGLLREIHSGSNEAPPRSDRAYSAASGDGARD